MKTITVNSARTLSRTSAYARHDGQITTATQLITGLLIGIILGSMSLYSVVSHASL